MVNKNKVKGSAWEKDFADLIEKNVKGSKAKRVPASGAMGTHMNEPLLQGDVKAMLPGLNKDMRVECKVGYGGNTQITIQKEWIDKIVSEAENSYSYPALACKFLGARKSEGVQYFIILDLDTFFDIINYIGSLSK